MANKYFENLREFENCVFVLDVEKVKYSERPPKGYRFVYVDELLQNENFKNYALGLQPFNRLTNPRKAPVAMINGWTDGVDVHMDCGEKKMEQMFVTKTCYPSEISK